MQRLFCWLFLLTSHLVLSVVEDLLPHLRNDQILLDLAKGLVPVDQMNSEVISEKHEAAKRTCRLCVMMGATITPELARGALYVSACCR